MFPCQYLSLVTLQTVCVQYGTQKWAVGGEPGKNVLLFLPTGYGDLWDLV